MDFKEIGVNTRNGIDLAQDRNYWRALVNMRMNLLVRKAMMLGSKEITYGLYTSGSPEARQYAWNGNTARPCPICYAVQ